MLLNKDNYYQSRLLASYPGIIHGYSTRPLGDMRLPHNVSSFLSIFALDASRVAMGKQVHGKLVSMVDQASVVANTDGVMTKTPGLALGVLVGDCVPLLFADPVSRSVAAVHAGWRGTLANISSETIHMMKQQGSSPKDIVVSIGPHIGACCYSIDSHRMNMFQDAYGNDPRMGSFWDNSWHLDLGYINALQLMAVGVSKDHIDAPIMCTSCQIDRFYSYRKDTKETFGEMIGVIAVQ
jgi:polyphenol oxidase